MRRRCCCGDSAFGPCGDPGPGMICMPAKDLTITFKMLFSPPVVGTLVFDPVAKTWTSACLGGFYRFMLTCGGIQMVQSQFNGCGGSESVCWDFTPNFATRACDPYYREYTRIPGQCVGINVEWITVTE